MIFKGMHVITCLMQISLKTLFWYWQGINIVHKINPPARASQQRFDVLLFSHSPNRLCFFPSFRICCPCERIILLLPLQWRITWQPTPHPGNPPPPPPPPAPTPLLPTRLKPIPTPITPLLFTSHLQFSRNTMLHWSRLCCATSSRPEFPL